jgi:hypothetical protein
LAVAHSSHSWAPGLCWSWPSSRSAAGLRDDFSARDGRAKTHCQKDTVLRKSGSGHPKQIKTTKWM